ncbi:hypothetical protein ACN27E_15335 [Mycobacterium sp. WMMD1722]|uniref:hypothetical protein n=1 Tax=Mycobacterium sp. WMMD1722 TaxID=3404117 RepID=UPI003BF5658F
MARDDNEHDQDAPAPWHNSTAKVLAASVAAVAAIGLIVGAVVFVSDQAEEPTQAPLNFVDPSFSGTSAPSTVPSTSAPATTTGGRPLNPQTTDIDLPPPSETPPPPSTSPPSTSRRLPSTKEDEPEESSEDDDSGPTTTRRPRFNETRTLYPVP